MYQPKELAAMRTIDVHKVNPVNDVLDIAVLDDPGAGGANHLYRISGFDPARNPSLMAAPGVNFRFSLPEGAEEVVTHLDILFQNGPIAERGVNGLTQEVLLAIVVDRLNSFQNGPFANRFNEDALRHVEAALHILHERTKERVDRGVEGTLQA